MNIDDAINTLMTCSPGVNCPREEACFAVATRLKELLAHSRTEAVPESDPDMVAHYAPHWEAHRPDWSAA